MTWTDASIATLAMIAACCLLLLIGYLLLTLVILLIKQLRVSDIDGMYLPETTLPPNETIFTDDTDNPTDE